MGKNNYSGTEVYISKLNKNTNFHCRNGHWDGKLIIQDGIPKIESSDGSLSTISEKYILNISTNSIIPKEAYVYESAYLAYQLGKETIKFRQIISDLTTELIHEDNRNQLHLEIESIVLQISNINQRINHLNEKYRN